MTKSQKNNLTKWIIIAIAVAGFIFNSGVTYNHLHGLTRQVEKLEERVICLDEKVDSFLIKFVQAD